MGGSRTRIWKSSEQVRRAPSSPFFPPVPSPRELSKPRVPRPSRELDRGFGRSRCAVETGTHAPPAAGRLGSEGAAKGGRGCSMEAEEKRPRPPPPPPSSPPPPLLREDARPLDAPGFFLHIPPLLGPGLQLCPTRLNGLRTPTPCPVPLLSQLES